MDLILASSSPHRKKILSNANIHPTQIIPANIDETIRKTEKHIQYVKRMAVEKCSIIAKNQSNAIIIAADTIVICRGKILDKALSDIDVEKYLKIISGNTCKIITAVCVMKTDKGKLIFESCKLVTSKAKMKRLTNQEIITYVESKAGIGKSGGLEGEGAASSFIKYFSGSWSGTIGLPIYETTNLLTAAARK